MRIQTLLLPLLGVTPTLAAPIPLDITVLGMCLTGHKTCHDGPGLFTSMFGSSTPTSSGRGRGGSGIMARSEQDEQLGVASLLGSLPLVSSLFGTGSQGEGVDGFGSGGGGMVKKRGEELGISGLLGNLPLLSSLFGSQQKNSPSTTPSTSNPMLMGATGMGGGMGGGRGTHPGGSIGI